MDYEGNSLTAELLACNWNLFTHVYPFMYTEMLKEAIGSIYYMQRSIDRPSRISG